MCSAELILISLHSRMCFYSPPQHHQSAAVNCFINSTYLHPLALQFLRQKSTFLTEWVFLTLCVFFFFFLLFADLWRSYLFGCFDVLDLFNLLVWILLRKYQKLTQGLLTFEGEKSQTSLLKIYPSWHVLDCDHPAPNITFSFLQHTRKAKIHVVP